MRASTIFRSLSRSERAPILDIRNATFYKHPPTASSHSDPIFTNLTFQIPSFPQPAQSWAILGSSAEVRTNFLEALRGNLHCDPPTARTYPYLNSDEILQKDARLRSLRNAIGYVGFDAERGPATLRGAYLSARYESHREISDFKVADYLMGKTELNANEELSYHPPESLFKDLVYILDLRELLDMPVSNLSNGQTRRARIARALLFQPELLLLNSPFMGIDQYSKEMIDAALHQYNTTYSPRLLFSLGSMEYMPTGVTHMAFIGPGNKIFVSGTNDSVYFNLRKIREALNQARIDDMPMELAKLSEDSYNVIQSQLITGRTSSKDATDMVRRKAVENGSSSWTSRDGFASLDSRKIPVGEVLVEMRGVKVAYGDKTILGGWKEEHEGTVKEGLWWKIRRGERWGVFGANGSGKTTLTAVVTSDHPQAYSLPVKIFGQSRLPEPGAKSVSIFDLQQRIGISSPEVHAFFPKNLSIRRVLESAWADAPLAKVMLNPEVDSTVSAVLRWFQGDICPDLGDHRLFQEESLHRGAKQNELEPRSTLHFNDRRRFLSHYEAIFDPSLLDWADERTFGRLSFTSQRLMLFLRAIIKNPDLVILDEAFSGMDASLVQKCHSFLAWGENAQLKYRTPGNKSGLPSRGRTPQTRQSDLSNFGLVNYAGLKDEQALIVISHTAEEVPGSVRQWLRLPEPGSGESAQFGVLDGPLEADMARWKSIWWSSTSSGESQRRKPRMLKVEKPRIISTQDTTNSIILSNDWDKTIAALVGGENLEDVHPPSTSGESNLTENTDIPQTPRSHHKVLNARMYRATRTSEQKQRIMQYEREYHRRARTLETSEAKRRRLERRNYLVERRHSLVFTTDEDYVFQNQMDRMIDVRASALLTRILSVDRECRRLFTDVFKRLKSWGLIPNSRDKKADQEINLPIEILKRARFRPVDFFIFDDPRITEIAEEAEKAIWRTANRVASTKTTLAKLKQGRYRPLRSPTKVAKEEDQLFERQLKTLPLHTVAERSFYRNRKAIYNAVEILNRIKNIDKKTEAEEEDGLFETQKDLPLSERSSRCFHRVKMSLWIGKQLINEIQEKA